MSIRGEQVTRIVRAAAEHDKAAAAKGWKTDEETDRLRAVYDRARGNATPEERDVADKII
jgi:hypothetical protein